MKQNRGRYFIIFWNAVRNGGEQSAGNNGFVIGKTEPFINRVEVITKLKELHPDLLQVCINNIIELTKSEYIHWNKN